MNPITLFSSDDRLATRINRSLAEREQLVRRAIPHASFNFPREPVLVVLDCRTMDSPQAGDSIQRLRQLNETAFRCAAIAALTIVRHIEVLGTDGLRDIDIILSGRESLGMLIRAIAHDPIDSASAAIALAAIDRRLPPEATRIAAIVLTSGLQVSTVKQVEKVLHRDRSTLGEYLAKEHGPSPGAVTHLARNLYAAVLLRRTALSIDDIGGYIGYSAGRWAQHSVRELFGCSAQELRSREPDKPIDTFLDELIEFWKDAQAEKKRGDRRSNTF